ncbi:MAG: hypothetical protein Q7S87_10375 [Agitococcus sp.]|nr:hypothetical protein [Agitococcus sp.]MDO9179467.1 hypothetical protein [Agitococcus sp.]
MATKRQVIAFNKDFREYIEGYGATATEGQGHYQWKLETPLGTVLFSVPEEKEGDLAVYARYEDVPRAVKVLKQAVNSPSGKWNWLAYSWDTPATLMARVQAALAEVMNIPTEVSV